jgi:multiple sugar transport system substrate-binding protein
MNQTTRLLCSLLTLLLIATIVTGTLTGCRKKRRAPEGVKVLEVWQGFNFEETALFREIMKDFEKEYEAKTGQKLEVRVQYVAFGDMFTKLRTAALARMTPDIAFMDSIKVTELALGQALVPIDELESFRKRYGSLEKAREEFVPASFDAGVVNRLGEEHLYGMPVQTTTVSLFWNREIFRQRASALRAAGLDPTRAPRDWEEVEAYGRVLTDPPRVYGFGLHGSLWFNFTIFNMYGVDFVQYDEEGKAIATINSPRGLAALQRIQSLVASGVEGGAWQRSALGPEPGFLNDLYAMVLTGPWNVENFTNAGKDFDIAMIPAPTMEEVRRLGLEPRLPGGDPDDPRTYSSSNVGGQTGVILRLCEDRDLAFELLEYFTSEPVQRRWASSLGQIPVRKAAWENLDTSKFPFMPKFMQQLATARRIPQIPLYGVLENDLYNPEIDLLLNNRQTPEQMLRRMENGMNQKIFDRINESLEAAKRQSARGG